MESCFIMEESGKKLYWCYSIDFWFSINFVSVLAFSPIFAPLIFFSFSCLKMFLYLIYLQNFEYVKLKYYFLCLSCFNFIEILDYVG